MQVWVLALFIGDKNTGGFGDVEVYDDQHFNEMNTRVKHLESKGVTVMHFRRDMNKGSGS